MAFLDVDIVVSSSVETLMAERGIRESDVKEVIATAEKESAKLYSEDETRFLAKKRLENFTVYVEYKPSGNAFEILNVYSHRVSLTEDEENRRG
jgi:hypothetical protein